MSELTIRKVENGYVITEIPGQYEDDLCYVARTDKDMIDHVTEFFFGDHAEWDRVTPPDSEPESDEPVYPQEVKDPFSVLSAFVTPETD